MNKKSIINSLFNKRNKKIKEIFLTAESKYCEMDKESMLKALTEAKQQWEVARGYFELINEDKLIDYAIYMEAAAKARYVYLFLKAKKMGIRAEIDNCLEKIMEI